MDPDVGTPLLLSSLLLVGLVAIIGGFLHSRRERLLTHAERMRALELGQALPDDPATSRVKAVYAAQGVSPSDGQSKSNPQAKFASTCFKTALWVAFWGFLFAGQSGGLAGGGVAIAIGASTGAIGVTLAICGTILASRASTTAASVPSYKMQTDPDAFDVVGRRG